MAADFPSSIPSVLSNFWVIAPTAEDLARYEAGNATADESVAIQGYQGFFGGVGGYFTQQALQPLQIAILLTDSPVGNGKLNFVHKTPGWFSTFRKARTDLLNSDVDL